MKSRGQYEQAAVALSIDSGHRIIWRMRGLNYEIFRVIEPSKMHGGSVTLIKRTASPSVLVSTIKKACTTSPRKNPAERTGEAAARSLVENFTGREVMPDEYELVPTPAHSRTLAQVGKIAAIEYVAFRDDKEYRFRHEFKVRSRPALAVSPDGKTVTMIGGSWKFGEDGFEDE